MANNFLRPRVCYPIRFEGAGGAQFAQSCENGIFKEKIIFECRKCLISSAVGLVDKYNHSKTVSVRLICKIFSSVQNTA